MSLNEGPVRRGHPVGCVDHDSWPGKGEAALMSMTENVADIGAVSTNHVRSKPPDSRDLVLGLSRRRTECHPMKFKAGGNPHAGRIEVSKLIDNPFRSGDDHLPVSIGLPGEGNYCKSLPVAMCHRLEESRVIIKQGLGSAGGTAGLNFQRSSHGDVAGLKLLAVRQELCTVEDREPGQIGRAPEIRGGQAELLHGPAIIGNILKDMTHQAPEPARLDLFNLFQGSVRETALISGVPEDETVPVGPGPE